MTWKFEMFCVSIYTCHSLYFDKACQMYFKYSFLIFSIQADIFEVKLSKADYNYLNILK